MAPQLPPTWSSYPAVCERQPENSIWEETRHLVLDQQVPEIFLGQSVSKIQSFHACRFERKLLTLKGKQQREQQHLWSIQNVNFYNIGRVPVMNKNSTKAVRIWSKDKPRQFLEIIVRVSKLNNQIWFFFAWKFRKILNLPKPSPRRWVCMVRDSLRDSPGE